jgi:hypothetical protein
MPVSLVEKYGSKICPNTSGAMPWPVSATSNLMLCFSAEAAPATHDLLLEIGSDA